MIVDELPQPDLPEPEDEGKEDANIWPFDVGDLGVERDETLEESEEKLKDFSRLVATHYYELRNNGLPIDLINGLIANFHIHGSRMFWGMD